MKLPINHWEPISHWLFTLTTRICFVRSLHISWIPILHSVLFSWFDVYLNYQVFSWGHSSKQTGHSEVWKTLDLISCNYWWFSMAQDVKDFVVVCSSCTKTKGSHILYNQPIWFINCLFHPHLYELHHSFPYVDFLLQLLYPRCSLSTCPASMGFISTLSVLWQGSSIYLQVLACTLQIIGGWGAFFLGLSSSVQRPNWANKSDSGEFSYQLCFLLAGILG